MRWLLLAIVAVVLAVSARASVLRPATALPGSHFNRGQNAAWLDIVWANDPHTQEEIRALGEKLERNQIRHVFVYVSYLKDHGQFNPTYSYAKQFTRVLKGAHPGLDVQAWIGLPLARAGQADVNGYVDLSDPGTRAKVAAFCATMVQSYGFDGIHLDAEPIDDGDESVLLLLEEVRTAIGPAKTLSIATRRIWPFLPDMPWPTMNRVAWSSEYYREIARRANQIAVMTYDSALPNAGLYSFYLRLEVVELTRALESSGAELFIGVPTSREETRTHRPEAENMHSGLQGVIQGLNDEDAKPAVVTGVAIYPEWETDEADWAVYRSLWLGQDTP